MRRVCVKSSRVMKIRLRVHVFLCVRDWEIVATRTFTSKVQRVHHASSTCPQSPAAADKDFLKNINTANKLNKWQFKLILVWFNKVLQCLNFKKIVRHSLCYNYQLHTYFTSLKNSGDLSSHGHGSCCTAAAPCRRFSIGFSVIIKSQIFSTLLFSEPSLVIIFIIDLNDSSTFGSWGVQETDQRVCVFVSQRRCPSSPTPQPWSWWWDFRHGERPTFQKNSPGTWTG